MQFFKNCVHILTRTQSENFKDMFLVKIANKGTSLTQKRSISSNSTFLLLDYDF